MQSKTYEGKTQKDVSLLNLVKKKEKAKSTLAISLFHLFKSGQQLSVGLSKAFFLLFL